MITPSLPTFCIALAIIWPTSLSPFDAMVPIWAISSDEPTFLDRPSISLTTAVTAMSMPRLRSIGFMPAATELDAFLHDGGGEHGGGGGAVAGEVAGLRGHLAHHLGAHVLELVGKLDLLGDGDAVLGDARRAEGLVEDDVAALRPERDLHGVVEDVDAAQHPVARVGGEADVFGSHELASCRMECRTEGEPIRPPSSWTRASPRRCP